MYSDGDVNSRAADAASLTGEFPVDHVMTMLTFNDMHTPQTGNGERSGTIV